MMARRRAEPTRKRFTPSSDEPEIILIEDLRGVLWNSRAELGLSWKDIAGAARLNYATVCRFASGDTKRPTFYTIVRVMLAVGVQLLHSPAPRSSAAPKAIGNVTPLRKPRDEN